MTLSRPLVIEFIEILLYILNNLKKLIRFLTKIGLVSGLILCFGIYQNKSFQIDAQCLVWLAERRNNYFDFFFQAMYIIGNTYVAGGIVVIALALLSWRKCKQEALGFGFATLGILILVDEILKPFFDRRRPPKPRLVEDLSRDSFPSGHAAGNLVLYFYLSFIIAEKYPRLRVYVYSLATAIIILIGLASVYTKAHWLTDVLAGYTFGYLWLIISLNLLKFLQR